MARVEEMTRQLEEVRRGRELRQGPQGDTHRELEKLRRELMVSGGTRTGTAGRYAQRAGETQTRTHGEQGTPTGTAGRYAQRAGETQTRTHGEQGTPTGAAGRYAQRAGETQTRTHGERGNSDRDRREIRTESWRNSDENSW